MPSAFAQLLKDLIDTRFKSRRAFVRAASAPSRENAEQAYLAQVLAGKKPAPMEKVDTWADALKLSTEDRERFHKLAAISHMPASVQPRFVQLVDDYQRLRVEHERLLADLKSLTKR